MRWLLLDEYTDREPDAVVAACAGIDGLFVDLAPPPVERYVLLGCAPAGRLRAALDGTAGAWLGNLVVEAAHDPDAVVELVDLTLVGHNRSVTAPAPGLLDIDLTGRVRPEPPVPTTAPRLAGAGGYRLTGYDGDPWGACRDLGGVFRERPRPLEHPTTLRGCRPEPPLRAAIDALARGAGNPGGAPRRRRIDATIHSVADDGTATRTMSSLHASVAAARPSAYGADLLDVTLDAAPASPMPAGAREIWQLWRAGPPTGYGLWARYDRELRHQWAGAALCHRRRDQPDRPAGSTYHLDGRHVTDIEGFYCALGEAVNGPGGYFGWNADAVHDCTRGGFGASWPFRLVWHDAAVAREHLVRGYDRRAWAPAVTLDDLLRWLAEDGIEVELR
ncbi:MAG: barstar family protein [Mycobacteriales bacterium]